MSENMTLIKKALDPVIHKDNAIEDIFQFLIKEA